MIRLLFALLVLSWPSWAAIAYVNSIHTSSGSTGNGTATLTWTPTVGNILVVGIDCYYGALSGGTCVVGSVTDSKSNSYAQIGPTQYHTTNNSVTAAIYCAPVTATGASTVITSHLTQAASGGDSDLVVTEYSGASCAVDASASGSDAGTASAAYSAGPITTTNANDLLVAMGTSSQGTAPTAGSGYTMRQNTIGSAETFGFEDQIVTSTGSYSATMTTSTATSWAIVLVALKAAASAIVGFPHPIFF